MNELKNLQFTPKKVAVGIIVAVLFILLYQFFAGFMMQSSLGLSGGVTTSAPPAFNAPMMSDSYKGVAQNRMMAESAPAYDAEYLPSPLPVAGAPAGASKIVKNGELSLLVKNIDEAVVTINSLRVSLLGQPGNASFSEYSNGGKQGDITIWVPSDKFDEAMNSIKQLAIRVSSERVNVQDVSAQYVDLESRSKNLKASEAQYLSILKQSGKIADVLAVTQQLNQTRAEIEQTQGQMDYLSRQVTLSSIHMSLTQEAVPGSVVTSEWRPMSVAKTAFRNTIASLTNSIDAFIVILISLPVILLNLGFWVLVGWIVYRMMKYAYRRVRASGVS